MNLKNELCRLMNTLEFPSDAQKELSDAFDKINSREFSDILAFYERDINCDYSAMLSAVSKLGEASGVHQYTAHLLLFLCLAPKLYERIKNNEPFYYGHGLFRYKNGSILRERL